ncbi:unnamed protein product [Urochloa humidicola]
MAPRSRQGDRLSALPDAALARVLSHLPTQEAARSSVLSRRWRHVHRANPVLQFVDSKRGERYRSADGNPVCFEHQVTSALINRDPTAPIRGLRLDVFNPTITLPDQWIIIAADSGAEDVDLKVRYWDSYGCRLCPFAPYEDSSADFNRHRVRRYVDTPRRLFRSATLRRLRLVNWTLDVPRDLSSMASLERLVLHKIMDDGDALTRLVSSCRRLVDLTLEECPSAREIAVVSARLWSFTMVCCHNATRVVLDSPCLRSMCYRGGLPSDGSFFSIGNCASIAAMTIDICEDIGKRKPREVGTIAELISRCTNLRFLHLSLHPEMAYYSSLFTGTLRGLRHLRRLELKGSLHNEHSVNSVAVLLQNTRKLEVLTLFPRLPDPPKKKAAYYYLSDSDCEPEEDKSQDDDDYSGHVHVPRGLNTANIRCFESRLRRINIVGYGGRPFERMLAKFLLSKAVALKELCVSIAPRRDYRDEMKRELEYWLNARTRFTCS